MKKLLMLAALLGMMTVSAGAEAHDYSDKHHYNHGKSWHHGQKYQPVRYTRVVYPPSCYAVKVDWFGHHSRVLRASCRQNAHRYTQVYYYYPKNGSQNGHYQHKGNGHHPGRWK